MKVGVYFPGFVAESGGGYTFEQEILASLIRLAPQSHHAFTLFFDPPFHPMVDGQGIKSVCLSPEPLVKRIPFSRTLRRLGLAKVPTGNRLQRAVVQEQVEFLWFPTFCYVPVDLPYIATVWDIQHRLQPWFPEVSRNGVWDYRERLYSEHLRKAAFIITGAHAGRQELSFFYNIPPERIRLLPHPTPVIERIPTETEVAAALKKYAIPGQYLFYPAQFWPHKNHVNLLLALRELRQEYGLPLTLVLAGSSQGDEANEAYVRKQVAEFGLQDQVFFLGFIPREDLLALYRGAFALVYITFFGPDNLPPLEAFALGCPVVASNVAGAEEQLGEAALLVDGRKPEEIARAVHTLNADSQLRKTLVEKGYARSTKFTGLDFVSGIFALLDEFAPVRRCWE